MDTQKRLHENISALADGELPLGERELAMAALGTADGQAAWRAYHLIGDVLRDQASGALGSGFEAALAARLAAEPAHGAGQDIAAGPASAGTHATTAAQAGAEPSHADGEPAESQSEPNADVILP